MPAAQGGRGKDGSAPNGLEQDMTTVELIDPALARNIAGSAVLAASVLGMRGFLAARVAKGEKLLTRQQRCRLFHIRSVSAAALALGLGAIWIAELQMLLLSLTAVIVAFVIATKELIQCASGSLLRTAGGLFRIGDWIEIDGARGEIVDHGLLTTTLLEMESGSLGYGYTGRMLVLPNSQLFTASARVQRFGRRFVPHRFTVTFEPAASMAEVLAWWDRETARAFGPFRVLAVRYHRTVARRLQGAPVGPEPQVTLATSELGRLRVEVMLFCPTTQAMALERQLKAGFLDWLAEREGRSALFVPERGNVMKIAA